MAAVDHVELRSGVYQDSVTLMRMTQAVTDTAGVLAAQVAMATALNIELAVGLGFSVPEQAGGNDLLVAVRAADQVGIDAGLAALDAALAAAEQAARTSGGLGSGPAPRTVRVAAESAPDAAVVLLSIPGGSVIGEAMDAINAGRHPMIFSDNVPVEHEIALKEAAERAGVLVMGPDCGTAIIGGVGLGFANVLRGTGFSTKDRVGIVAASGTGAQQLTCLLDEAGVGISHVLGVGGRDLSEAVGARSALTALRMLDADPGTDRIVVISKPAHPSSAAKLAQAAAASSKPVTLLLIGKDAADITTGAESVIAELGIAAPQWFSSGTTDTSGGLLRGLFAGGTLADEAMVLAAKELGDITSNIPLSPELALPESAVKGGVPTLTGLGHTVIDLGDDAFTQGRGHPMIDPTVRLDLITAQGSDPQVGVLLLDVVLGHCAEADPIARLVPAIRAARDAAKADGRKLGVVVSLCGTESDPQGRDRQRDALVEAGAIVFASNAHAARHAAALARTSTVGTQEFNAAEGEIQ